MESTVKKSITGFLMAVSLSAITLQAQALTITPSYTPQWTSSAGPSQNAIIADFDAQLNAVGRDLGTGYFKQDLGGGETGGFEADSRRDP